MPGSAKLFAPHETLTHWVIGACDSNGNVALQAETALRLAGPADLESAPLVDELTTLLLGAQVRAAGGRAGAKGRGWRLGKNGVHLPRAHDRAPLPPCDRMTRDHAPAGG
eukprot:527977-Prymnesium_polylepis.1